MSALGKLVATLREARGMTQGMLATAAGCDPETISQVERGLRPRWNRRISHRVFDVLHKRLPLTNDEAAQFLGEAGLSLELAKESRIEVDIAREDAGLPVPGDQLSREMRQAHRALLRLLEAIGPTRAIDLMEAVANAADPARPPHAAPKPRQLTVVEPPKVPFPGAVEQVHRTYEVQTPKPTPKPKAKPKKRTG